MAVARAFLRRKHDQHRENRAEERFLLGSALMDRRMYWRLIENEFDGDTLGHAGQFRQCRDDLSTTSTVFASIVFCTRRNHAALTVDTQDLRFLLIGIFDHRDILGYERGLR